MLPVVMLAAVVAATVIQSLPALRLVGIPHLFGPVFSGPAVSSTVSYGLLPPIWGTLMVVVVSLGVAVPPALALALLSTEFPFGPLTRYVDVILGTLGGIPPIIYAILGQLVVETFMRAKFAGEAISNPLLRDAIVGSGPDRLPATRVPEAMPNSVLLGAAMIALMIVPYITPLVQDAIRGVPAELREASYGLGASRWYTTTHVVLPGALAGIITGVTLGALRAIGEVEIAYFCIGSAGRAIRMPVPLWDIFEGISPLPSAGAGLLGGIGGEGEGGISGAAGAVSSFTGLLLLILAAMIVAGSTYVQRALTQRSRT